MTRCAAVPGRSGAMNRVIVPLVSVCILFTAGALVAKPQKPRPTTARPVIQDARSSIQLTPSRGYIVGTGPVSITAADFDRDGHIDLAVACVQSWDITILMGDGTGRFTWTGSLVTAPYPSMAVAGDLNNDQKADLAVIHLENG